VAAERIAKAALRIASAAARQALRTRRYIIRSKKAAMKKRAVRTEKLTALRRESDRALREMIRQRLALPPARRMNFLRKRIVFRGSAL
jgi:hypothetical protein